MKILVSVSNDVLSDNRVKKTTQSLKDYGFEVHLLCKKADRQEFDTPYKRHDTRTCFKRNVFYYAELNLRFFFKALFQKMDVLWANDLDTLLPMFLVSRLKNKPLVFDSHEKFTEVAELKNNPTAKRFWKFLERSMVPKLKYVTTVCDPIKDYFFELYGVKALVIRNIPPYSEKNQQRKIYPLEEKILIWQGAANIDRSLEDLVLAMREIDAKLFILGKGDVMPVLQQMVKDNALEDKVLFMGRLPFDQMMDYTRRATLGLSLDRPTNENYAISLPNKIFEYINAATPVLATPLQEIKKIIQTHKTGVLIEQPTSENLAKKINALLVDNALLQQLSDNCLQAQKTLSWQEEEKVLFELMDKILGK